MNVQRSVAIAVAIVMGGVLVWGLIVLTDARPHVDAGPPIVRVAGEGGRGTPLVPAPRIHAVDIPAGDAEPLADAAPEEAAMEQQARSDVSTRDLASHISILAEETIFGGVDSDTYLEAALDALALIGDQPADKVESGVAIYEIQDGQGTMARVLVPLDAASTRPSFALKSEIPVRPGFVTGCLDDGVDRLVFELDIVLGHGRGVARLGSMADSAPHYSEDLLSYIVANGRPVVRAGTFLWDAGDGASWQQVTLDASVDEAGVVNWQSSMVPPENVEVALGGDPRMVELAQAVAELQELNQGG